MSKFMNVIRAFGLVFGDIGTSPIYTISVIFLIIPSTLPNIMGIISLIIWTLIILVTVEYSWLAMSLGKGNEGGTIVLKELLLPLLKNSKTIAFFTLLTFLGISLLIGDGVITPAISILSAVEGILLIPGFANVPQNILIVIAATIAILLFSFQKHGIDKISSTFGPIMTIWFISLTLIGVAGISSNPQIISAINPIYGLNFLIHNGLIAFLVLSEVILCATGAEALYTDMGHIGKRPIQNAWKFVFIALVINYLGQGAFLITHPHAKNILFEMVSFHFTLLYVPFLLLAIIATVIASQALISGIFSIFYQAINTHILPLLKFEYTSSKLRSQIYIDSINWLLLILVLIVMFVFKESSKLAAAYGFAVTGTMCIDGIIMTTIFYLTKRRLHSFIAGWVTTIVGIFFVSNLYKLPAGGYWSILIASIPFLCILLFTTVQRKIFHTINFMKQDHFLKKFDDAYKTNNRIKGTAIFLIGNINLIPPYIINTLFNNGIIYEDNIALSIVVNNEPFGISGEFKERITDGLRRFEINYGYMEILDVEAILSKSDIHEKVIFYGMEDIVTKKFIYKLFATFKKVTPSFVQFYKLPINKTHGVITIVEL